MKKTILIVDDQPVNRLVLSQILKPIFTVYEAVDGVDGVDKALQIVPDLILLDVMMPRMDGYHAATILKQSPSTKHIPIIFVSASNTPDTRNKCMAVGAVDYISKPFPAALLLARVKTHLL